MQNWRNILVAGLFVLAACFSLPATWLVMGFALLLSRKAVLNKHLRILYYALSIWVLAYINTTKPLLTSDLGYYYWLYDFAGKKSLVEFYLLIPKDPLYHLYSYVSYYLTFGNFKLFLLLTTALMYLPVLLGTERILRIARVPGRAIFAACLCLLFFSEYFFYTAQLMRQVLAGSLAFYIITQLMSTRHRVWLYLLPCCGFIHGSAFIFCSFYFVRYFIKKRNVSVWKLLCWSLALSGLSPLLAAYVAAADSTLGYAARRLAQGTGDTVYLGPLPLLVVGSMLPMSVWGFIKTNDLGMREFYGIVISLTLFLVVNFPNQFFVLRFMEYCYMFLPLVAVMFAMQAKPLRPWIPLLPLFLLCRFLFKLSTSVFNFIPSAKLLQVNMLDFLLQFCV